MEVTDIHFTSAKHVIDEIRNMNVKGGSPFGRAAAWAYRLAAEQETFSNREALIARFDVISAEMFQLKPTMATIFNSKDIVYQCIESVPATASVDELKRRIITVCDSIISYSMNAVAKLGEYGANIIHDGDIVMMHSYSSALMSVFITAAHAGKKFSVICTESRPLRESRLAAKILQSHKIPVTYITDASVWEFMKTADYIIAGADTITWNGSVANKMGTAQISQLALSCQKPVYIASEIYKLDRRTKNGYQVLLERRSQDEMIEKNDFESLDGITVINQFFDLTPACHITSLITEEGVIAPSSVSEYWHILKGKILSGNQNKTT